MILAYGCIYQGGYVYAFDDTTPTTGSVGGKVITTSFQNGGVGVVWAANGNNTVSESNASYDEIPGTDQVSTSTVGSPTYATFTTFYTTTYTTPAIPFTSASFFPVCWK